MKTLTLSRYASCLALGISLVIYMGAVAAQPMSGSNVVPDPLRWTQEDVTPAQKLSTATKEAVNAHAQFMNDCKSQSAARYAACAAEVDKNYELERAEIRRRFGS
jgi:hypothetical protein